ncbi:MAG: polysaccharide biosynthesis tyrosine autokinase [Solirubrobacterales bacterium]|nr:polysaccharide biosynthesis tyrosine autokinase [Solirubrobacterales bacterium]
MLLPDGEASEQSSLRRYLDTLKERWLFVVLAVVVCTAAAAAYAYTAPEVYEAHADMLVTPVPDDQTALLGLGLIRRASDPTRDVTTAARLIGNIEVARRVALSLRSQTPPEALLAKIRVDPVAQSSIVAITAQGATPRAAQQLANVFAEAAVETRTAQLRRQLDPAIAALRTRIAEVPDARNSDEAQPLYEQLAALESLRSGGDPTLRIEVSAAEPTAAVSPRKRLALIGGVFAGLLLGVAGAFALSALDTRGERENRLASMGLSILARIPDTRQSGAGYRAFEEAFRLLRTMIRFASPDTPYRTIAVTSASEQEGKTTTSSQLALAALEAGQTVLLVEVDAYRPALGRVLDMPDAFRADHGGAGLLDYLAGVATLDEIIKPTAMAGLSFVPAGRISMESISGLLEQRHGQAFVRELAELADLVILDCPPVGPRSDAVLIAAIADAVVLVVDVKRSSDKELVDTVRRLRSARAELVGVVLNRDEATASEYDYLDSATEEARTTHPERAPSLLRSTRDHAAVNRQPGSPDGQTA